MNIINIRISNRSILDLWKIINAIYKKHILKLILQFQKHKISIKAHFHTIIIQLFRVGMMQFNAKVFCK